MLISTIFNLITLLVIFNHEIYANNFTCLNGEFSDASKICDGNSDCIDSSDERSELCSTFICQSDQFKCLYGACIDREKFCNGEIDCIDGSDEFNCGKSETSCDFNEFRCSESTSNIKCIESSLICNGILDCPSGEDETEKICQPQICPSNTFRCSHGRCIDEKSLCDNFNDCLNGDDESDLLCKKMSCGYGPDCDTLDDGATLFCPSIISNRLHVSCKYVNRKVSCERNIRPGTIAEYVCRDFYQPKNSFYKYNNRAICQANGQWSSDILKCEPKCGYIKDTIPLIVNGFTIEPAAVPWHATIFIRSNNNKYDKSSKSKDSQAIVDEYEFACGATLISELVVLSAAHCFAYVNETSVKIAIGKRHSNFTISSDDDEPIAQYFDVIQIFRHPLYLDRLGNYGSDIALVELNQTVMMSDDIHPACIDWNWNELTWHLTNHSLGVVAGMGVTENEVTSEYLRVIKIPVVDDEHCITSHSQDFRKYITFTTFCAGWANGSSVCNGDSGGGLLFPSKFDVNKWIIQGIVSLSPRRQSTFQCDPKKFTIFTKVSLYRNWIRSVLDKIHEDAYKMLLDNKTDEFDPIL